jgi:hypothetical protein
MDQKEEKRPIQTLQSVTEGIGFNIKLPQYDHIELTSKEIDAVLIQTYDLPEDQVKEALRLARRAKDAMINESNYLRQISKERPVKSYTSAELIDQVIKSGYVTNDYNSEIITQLCYYFTEDPRFKYDLKKGIILFGPTGCGKTFTLSKFRQNQKQSFILKSCREVTYEFGQYGFSVLIHYGKNIQFPENRFGQTDYGVMFDDLGTDEDVRFYGNDKNPMMEILQQRYDNCDPKSTHITTNLTGDQIEEIYGKRVRSRLYEMFNPIEFNTDSPDMRRLR